jgi:hypothetical protein
VAGVEIVDADHLVSGRDEPFAEMRAEETGTAGHQDSRGRTWSAAARGHTLASPAAKLERCWLIARFIELCQEEVEGRPETSPAQRSAGGSAKRGIGVSMAVRGWSGASR